jgi:hypothetical protein
VQGHPREAVSSDLDHWIRAERLGSGARGVNGTTVGVASSVAVKSSKMGHMRALGGLGAPELARTGEGDPTNSMAGFRL